MAGQAGQGKPARQGRKNLRLAGLAGQVADPRLRKGLQYLFEIGLEHNDQKLENIVLFGENPKWIDFGVMHDHTGNESYRRMGYVRRGSKFRHFQALCKYSKY